MRYILLIIVLALTGWYFTTGIRLGMVTSGNVRMYNANGSAEYPLRTAETYQKLRVTGSCDVQKGTATLHFYDPKGAAIGSQVCRIGKWKINKEMGGQAGYYKMIIHYHNYTGTLNIQDNRN